ncbi:MAG: ABC transporter permease [Kiritimatiellia bacterium]|jgi:hypothetical protein|nr:ABC transporter permease subunit [Lentisphaerota bacterium]
MSSTLAITRQALRGMLRSRVVLVLLGVLVIAACWLPLTVRGDGTLTGMIRLQLTYPLGIGMFLLTLATLWAGCSGIAGEAETKTLHLLLVKPVGRFRIWLGKWFALLLINAVCLTIIAGAVGIGLQWQLRTRNFPASALDEARATTLAALQTLPPLQPDITAPVQQAYEQWLAQTPNAQEIPASVILPAIRRTVLARAFSVPPNDALTLHYPLARHPTAPYLAVQWRGESSVPGSVEINATVELRIGHQTFKRPIRTIPGSLQTIVFENLPAADQATLMFHNHGSHQNATLFFDPTDGLLLRQPVGRFATNYLHALIQMFARLALFAAIGLTLGTFFSRPVAGFLALVLVLILQLSGFITAAAQVDRATFIENVAQFGATAHTHDDSHPAPAPTLAARATAAVLYYTYRGTWLALRPLLTDRTLDDLSTGTHIPLRQVCKNLAQQALLFPLILGLLATAVLKKREWGQPALT